MLFIIALEKAVMKGSTPYYYLIMEIDTDWKEEIKVLCNEKEREDLSLKESYSAAVYNTIARVFKYLTKINIIVPGNFRSS